MHERTGGCLCGAVRYVVRGEPTHVGRCNCGDCRKRSGSVFTIYAHWPRDAFELSGTLGEYGDERFCPTCASLLYLDGADAIELYLGTLDDAPFELVPEAELWIKRRESWLPPVPGATQHDENRR